MRWIWTFVFAVVAVGCAPVASPDDAAQVALDWETPLDIEVLGSEVSVELDGASLQEIVSGQVEARGEGRTCTACHFDDTVTSYRPEVEQYSVAPVKPYDMVHGRTWAGNNGWAAIFVTLGEGAFVEKPADLRNAMDLWLDAEAERVAPLNWDGVIEAGNLGTVPESFIAGDTVGGIVNSAVPARPDDVGCSTCHYEAGPYPYRPEGVSSGDVTSFGPDTILDGRTWAGPNGWAEVFSELGPDASVHKPDYLRSMFFKWNDDGGY